MKQLNLISLLLAASLAIASLAFSSDAEAKRLGGGNNVGRSSNVATQKQAQQPQAPAPQANTPSSTQAAASTNKASPQAAAGSMAPQAAKKPWGGILGGLAMGLGLAALFSAFGMGGQFAEMMGSLLMVLLLAGALFFIWRMLRARLSPQPAVAGGAVLARSRSDDVGYYRHAGAEGHASASFKPEDQPTQTMARFGAPAGFDEAGFLSTAKQHYTRLQQAWDSGDLAEIERFTTPAMYTELKQQITARQGVDKTDVVTLDAQLLGIEDTGEEYLASVEFSGLIREETFGGAAPFREVWNLARDKAGKGGWMLAGIEQLNAVVH